VREEFERLLAEEPDERRAALRTSAHDGGRRVPGSESILKRARERVGLSRRISQQDAQIERIVTKYPELERWAQTT